MNFKLSTAIEILERTPEVLIAMLQNMDSGWTSANEGGETWSVYDIIGHLIHGEKTDWTPRMTIILSDNQTKTFEAFDRFAQFTESKDAPLTELLDEFKQLRKANISLLLSKQITEKELTKKGVHPVFGEVTLSQLLATWTVHDLNHIAQITRVMAKQYTTEVGPWAAYLKILES